MDGLQKLGIRRSALSEVEEIRIVHIYNRQDDIRIPSKYRGKLSPMTLALVYLDKKGSNGKKPRRGSTIPLSDPIEGSSGVPSKAVALWPKAVFRYHFIIWRTDIIIATMTFWTLKD